MSKEKSNEIFESSSVSSKTIAVWGLPGAGKSIFAAQVALLLAEQTGFRVLLADFDILFPTLDHYMGISKEPESVSFKISDEERKIPNTGLAYVYDAIERNIFSQKLLGEIVISHPKQKNLDILTGNYSLNMFEMLTEKHFDTIIEVAKKAYDYIILDINSVLFIDATFAALKSADVVYTISEGDYSSLREINKGLKYISTYISKEKFKVVINKYTRKHLDRITMEQVLEEIKIAQIIDYNDKHITSKIEKKPFVLGCSKSEKKPYLEVVEEITK